MRRTAPGRGRRGAFGLALAIGAAPVLGCASGGAGPGPGGADPLAEELRRELPARGDAAPPSLPLPGPRRPPAPVRREVFLEIERPARRPDPVVVRSVWLEVAGAAGTRGRGAYDVVIAIDVSGSTQYASGADVNGNGVVGERRRRVEASRLRDPRAYSSDPGDSVLAAEREATRRLIERLDPHRTRIGLLSFSDVARPRGALGSSRALLDLVLADLDGAFGAGATNLAEATRLAIRMLLRGGEDRASLPATEGGADPAPDPVVLILSDGYPTHPGSEARAAEEALRAAREARDAGIRVSSLALGVDAPREPDVFAEMAQLTGGEHLRVATPGDVVDALPAIDLAGVAQVEVRNLTTGAEGRALRLLPDGSFDAYVELAPGENRLRVTARGEQGGSASRERRVFYDDRAPPDPDALRRQRKAIELRTLEIELEREARRARAAQRKVIRVEPDPAGAP